MAIFVDMIEDRFQALVNKNGPIPKHRPELGPCWVWMGSKDKAGYGHFSVNGKVMLAHRFAMRDKLLEGMDCLHRCDNPSCVNREGHLFVGTHTENMRDSIEKGRNAFKLGEEHNLSKLTDEQAMLLKACPAKHGAAKRMTAALGVKRGTFYYIRSGMGWPHLPKPTEEDIARAEAFLKSTPGRSRSPLKLTDEQAILIKACPSTPGAAPRLARALGVAPTTVINIRNGKKWSHLPSPTPDDFARAEAFLASLP